MLESHGLFVIYLFHNGVLAFCLVEYQLVSIPYRPISK